MILFRIFIISLLSVYSLNGQSTYYIKIDIQPDELNYTSEQPGKGEYRIYIKENGKEQIRYTVPYYDEFDPLLIAQVGLTSSVRVLTFFIESVGYETYIKNIPVSRDSNVIDLGVIALKANYFPEVLKVIASTSDQLASYDVYFNNSHKRNFSIGTIIIDFSYEVPFQTSGMNLHSTPMTSIALDDLLIVEEGQEFTVQYESAAKQGFKYKATGQLELHPIQDRMDIRINLETNILLSKEQEYYLELRIPMKFNLSQNISLPKKFIENIDSDKIKQFLNSSDFSSEQRKVTFEFISNNKIDRVRYEMDN